MNMARTTLIAAITLAAGLLFGARPAAAQQLQVFPSRAALNAAANNQLAPVDFEELPDFGSFNTLSYPGLEIESVDPSLPNLLTFGPGFFPTLPSNTLVSFDFAGPEPGPVVLNFSPAVTAVGLDVSSFSFDGSISPAGSSLVVTVVGTDGTQSSTVSLTPDGPTFVGLGAVEGTISQVIISNPAGQARQVAVDNLGYGDLANDLDAVLQEIDQKLSDGRLNGTLRGLGRSLEVKLALVRYAAYRGDYDVVECGLISMRNEVRAQTGKKIARPLAAELTALIDESLALIPE
jgi:hypothetical protein